MYISNHFHQAQRQPISYWGMRWPGGRASELRDPAFDPY